MEIYYLSILGICDSRARLNIYFSLTYISKMAHFICTELLRISLKIILYFDTHSSLIVCIVSIISDENYSNVVLYFVALIIR